MQNMDQEYRPRSRLEGYDLARAVAILGMIIVHFGLVLGTSLEGASFGAAAVKFFDGRAAATFVVLAGIGTTLVTRRAALSATPEAMKFVRSLLTRRAIFLLVLGFINLAFWPGDILRVYGVTMLIAPWFVAGTAKRLWGGVALFTFGFIVLLGIFDYGKNWQWETMTYLNLWTLEGLARNLFYDGFRSVFPWSGLFLFGMWLGHLDLGDRKVAMGALVVGICVMLAAEFTSNYLLSSFSSYPRGLSVEDITALFGTESMPPLPLFLLASGGFAVATISTCTLVMKTTAQRWFAPLVSTGQQALTWYVTHIVLGIGLIVYCGLENSLSATAAVVCGIGFFIFAVITSSLWNRRFERGPLESFMRRVTTLARRSA